MGELRLEGLGREGLAYEVIGIEGRETVEVMLRLKAPDPNEEEARRWHTEIALDTSESMHPRKLFPALRGIDYLASHLRGDDRIGIVTIGGKAEVALPAGPVRDGEDVREVLRQIRPFGVADPVAGMLIALKEARRDSTGTKGQMILITDRSLFVRDRAIADRLAGVAKAANETGVPVTVISMDGKGSGFLSGIAHAGGGRMVGTTEGQRVCEVMLERIPGERGERIRGVEVLIEPCEKVRSLGVKGEEPIEAREDGLLIRVGDLRDGEIRDVLVEMEVDELEELQDDHVAGLSIQWSDLRLEKAFEASMPVKVNGYPVDPRPHVQKLFNTDPEERVLLEFPSVEVKLWHPSRVTEKAEGDEGKPSAECEPATEPEAKKGRPA